MKTGLWAKCTDPDDICSVLEQIPVCAGGNNFDAVAFLHGVCGIFALALHDRFDYRLDWVLDDEYDGAFKNNPWAHLVHVFCSITDGEDILATVDARGISDDFELFIDVSAAFLPWPCTTGSATSWTGFWMMNTKGATPGLIWSMSSVA